MLLFRGNEDSQYGSFAARLPYGVHWSPSVHRTRKKAFATVFEIRGFDRLSSDVDTRANRANALRDVVSRLGNRWWHEFHAPRTGTGSYPPATAQPNPTLRVLDDEQRQKHAQFGNFYETKMYVALGRRAETKIARGLTSFVLGARVEDEAVEDDSELEEFEQGVKDFASALTVAYADVRRLGCEVREDETGFPYVLDAIAGLADSFISGNEGPLAWQVDHPPLANGVIGGVDVVSGDFPEVNGWFYASVTIDGFPPWSIAGAMDFLNTLRVESRPWSRFRPVSTSMAQFRIGRRRLAAIARAGKTLKDENPLALSAARLLANANAEVTEGGIAYGWYSGGVVLRSRDMRLVEAEALKLVDELRNSRGFSARLERRVAFRSWLSSLLFNEGVETRPCFMSAWNAAHFFPLTSVWRGYLRPPSPKFRSLGITRPTRVAKGIGDTPINITPFYEDVGHRAAVGPQGAGKSMTLKGLIVGELLTDDRAFVIQFDSDYSSYAMNRALRGIHIDLTGREDVPLICPAANIHLGGEYKEKYFTWVDDSCALKMKRALTIDESQDVAEAIEAFAKTPARNRSLSAFSTLVKQQSIRQALGQLIGPDGRRGLLDAEFSLLPSRESMAASGARLVTFEIGSLARSAERSIPVFMAIFDWIESLLNGDPIDVNTDEVHKLFREGRYAARYDRLARELRKKNGWLTSASQYASDYHEGELARLMGQAIKNWFWLPNPDKKEKHLGEFLPPAAIEMRSQLTPKRHFMLQNPDGILVGSWEFGPLELGVLAVENVQDIAKFRELEQMVIEKNRQEGFAPGMPGYRDLLVPMWWRALGVPGWQEAGEKWLAQDPMVPTEDAFISDGAFVRPPGLPSRLFSLAEALT